MVLCKAAQGKQPPKQTKADGTYYFVKSSKESGRASKPKESSGRSKPTESRYKMLIYKVTKEKRPRKQTKANEKYYFVNLSLI